MARANRVKIINNIPERSKKYLKIMNEQIAIGLREAGDKILGNSQKRFSSHFSGGKFSNIFSAIRDSGVSIRQSGDGNVTLFAANMDILDSKTALPPTKAEENLYHFWRILHEGSGKLALARNPHIYGGVGKVRSSDYDIQVIVQTNVLEPLFSPGKHAPFFELLQLRGLPGIQVLRHAGFKGHQWFLNNLDLFDEDFNFIIKRMNQAMQRAETLSLG